MTREAETRQRLLTEAIADWPKHGATWSFGAIVEFVRLLLEDRDAQAAQIHQLQGTPAWRFTRLMELLEERYPDPEPYSARAYEGRFLAWLDSLTARLRDLEDTLGRQALVWRQQAETMEAEPRTAYRERTHAAAMARRTCAENLEWLVREWLARADRPLVSDPPSRLIAPKE